MKRPREPRNWYFWRGVVSDPEKKQEFLDRVGDNQRRNLILAIKYYKWEQIQNRKEKVYA